MVIHRADLTDWEWDRVEGVPCTTPLRTAVDLALTLPRDEAVVAIDSLLFRGLVTLDRLRAAVLSGGPRPGSVRARAVVDLVDPGGESVFESRVRLESSTRGCRDRGHRCRSLSLTGGPWPGST